MTEYYLVETTVENLRVGDLLKSPVELNHYVTVKKIVKLGNNIFIVEMESPAYSAGVRLDGNINVTIRRLA